MKQKITAVNMQENKVYIGLGSNLGDRKKLLKEALHEIEEFASIENQSKVIETDPVGYTEQPKFLNMVAEIKTPLTPLQLIFRLQEIEHKMGRTREIKNGPRTIDLDILLFGDKVINQPNLKIPHPQMHKRKFVMIPLNEIAPNTNHPTLNQSIKELTNELR